MKPGHIKKLDQKSPPCKLLRYDGSTIYKLLSTHGNTLRSNNVYFQETAKYGMV